ncbi:MAG: acetolactate synthase [Chloroflexi bacterium]|nr:acetolactate synthase [Chloroflexota bacterium]
MTPGQVHTGGRAVVEALLAAGVDHAFCVPGESFLGVLDALYDEPRIRVIATRHEGGAAFMAEAFGKLTRRPAVCMGTRMVGAGNLAIGIHTAHQDSTPLIALLGQVSTRARHREAFQEAELAQVLGPITKWAVEPPAADRLGELTLRAGRIAVSGRPGPVAIALREDLLSAEVAAERYGRIDVARPAPDPGQVLAALSLLRAAERPVLLVGGGVLAGGAEAVAACVRLAETEHLPVVTAWRRPDAFPNDHPLYAGMSGLSAPPSVARLLHASDVVLAIGTRLNEYTTFEYSVPAPGARLIHVDVCAELLGGLTTPALGCLADAGQFAAALAAAAGAEPCSPARRSERQAYAAAAHPAWERETVPSRGKARPEYLDQQVIVAALREAVRQGAIMATDAGNFSGWPARYVRWNEPGTFVGPTSGAMGYAIPAAIGAKLARPDRPVIATVGDGGFLMTGAEIETAVREQVPVTALVYDNQQYGTIRTHQQAVHPGRPIATALGPIDAAAFARSLGAIGLTPRDEGEIPQALREALQADRPAVLHLRVDPEQLSVGSDAPRPLAIEPAPGLS